MLNKSTKNIDLAQLGRTIASQFEGLNKDDPGTWPAVPRYAAYATMTVMVFGLLWYLWISHSSDELKTEAGTEISLRTEYTTKLAQAINLEALKKQREQVLLFVTQLEKQLPSKAEMDALLSDVNQAGLGRSLQFELFRPGQINVKEYYAELPIAVKVMGSYHDIGAFVADVANLSRIVTLNDLALSAAGKDGTLVMESTAKTFRYLDAEEVAEQRKAKDKAVGAKK